MPGRVGSGRYDMDFDVLVVMHGPLFEHGRADEIVDEFLHDAKKTVGDKALANWAENLDSSIRHPTPYYETQILNEPDGDAYVVNDRGIIYGPWLEGVGSRNRTTRFKGYFSLRRAFQKLHGEIENVIEPHVRRMIARLSGE